MFYFLLKDPIDRFFFKRNSANGVRIFDSFLGGLCLVNLRGEEPSTTAAEIHNLHTT